MARFVHKSVKYDLMVEILAAVAMCEEGHSWKFVLSQDRPVELGSMASLSKAAQEALRNA